jgi:hypothetical protein
VLGLNQLGEAIVLAAAHRWQTTRPAPDATLRLHVVDAAATDACARVFPSWRACSS